MQSDVKNIKIELNQFADYKALLLYKKKAINI